MDKHKYEKENEALNDEHGTFGNLYPFTFYDDHISKESFDAVLKNIQLEKGRCKGDKQ